MLAFPMGGDVIGLDGLDAERYASDVVALESSHVAVVSFARIARLGHEYPCIERLLYAAFSRELIRERNMIWLLGTLHAEARLATFLLDLSERFGRLGYSRASFALRMSREEIGSYLGIKLETVSRAFSAFAAAGLMTVDRKEVTLRDLPGLQRVVRPEAPAEARPVRSAQRATPRPGRARAAARVRLFRLRAGTRLGRSRGPLPGRSRGPGGTVDRPPTAAARARARGGRQRGLHRRPRRADRVGQRCVLPAERLRAGRGRRPYARPAQVGEAESPSSIASCGRPSSPHGPGRASSSSAVATAASGPRTR